uniref:Uncharacterized protein n=1 Tax=Arundo donax TaxID=35708 RepID=A0A0A8Z8R6_ARUDO
MLTCIPRIPRSERELQQIATKKKVSPT